MHRLAGWHCLTGHQCRSDPRIKVLDAYGKVCIGFDPRIPLGSIGTRCLTVLDHKGEITLTSVKACGCVDVLVECAMTPTLNIHPPVALHQLTGYLIHAVGGDAIGRAQTRRYGVGADRCRGATSAVLPAAVERNAPGSMAMV